MYCEWTERVSFGHCLCICIPIFQNNNSNGFGSYSPETLKYSMAEVELFESGRKHCSNGLFTALTLELSTPIRRRWVKDIFLFSLRFVSNELWSIEFWFSFKSRFVRFLNSANRFFFRLNNCENTQYFQNKYIRINRWNFEEMYHKRSCHTISSKLSAMIVCIYASSW